MYSPLGSLWRKWDLHIHTPASYEWQDGKRYRDVMPEERNAITRKIIDAMNKSDVDVFGIMDYWTLDGYIELKQFTEINKDITLNKTIFPGMELRIESPTSYRLNIHVLLSNELTLQQLKDFKNKLTLFATTRSLSDEGLIEVARGLGDDDAKQHGFESPRVLSDEKLLQLGSKTALINRESFEDACHDFKNNCVVILPFSSYNGLSKLDWKDHPCPANYFMRLADIFEERNHNTINLFLNKRTPENISFIDNVLFSIGGKPKPCVSGSDAHKFGDYGKYPEGKTCWIKADTTFSGIKQVINEPAGRTYIGDFPEEIKRVKNNSTKYIDSVKIDKKVNSEFTDEIWFSNLELQLNKGLIAIIGNKGSGKSALTDIVALLGNSKRDEDDFSFLNTRKFRQPKNNKAKHFEATLVWQTGEMLTKGLEESSTQDSEKVIYVPQDFFEKICNETENRNGSEFDQELKKAIFSHVGLHERLGCDSLDDLICFQAEEIQQAIVSLKASLHRINQEIVFCEHQLSPAYEREISAYLQNKRAELLAHENNYPDPVQEPVEHSEISQKISKLREQKDKIIENHQLINDTLKKCMREITSVDKLTTLVERFRSEYVALQRDSLDELTSLSLSLNEIVNFEIRGDILTQISNRLQDEKKSNENVLASQEDEMKIVDGEIADLQNQLEDEGRNYQAYLDAIQQWEQRKSELVGSAEINETIEYYIKMLSDIKTEIPLKYETLLKERGQILNKIYVLISRLADIQRKLYYPVQKFIQEHSLIVNKYKLNFEVSIGLKSDFSERIFKEYIKQNVKGTFYGVEEGRQVIRSLIEQHNFNTFFDVESFINEIINRLNINYGENDRPKVDFNNQLRKGSLELYDFLFSLEYLQPHYGLKLDSKNLPQLSPGERGILLLVFYLLVAADDCPLIIDQPEENLDNQSVFQFLVPCIKEAKQRRQIFMVTHNPNLAVACDADQIIYSCIDKTNKQLVIYESGSIENPKMNRRVVDVLEGTPPAFRKRDATYHKDVGSD